MKIGIFGGSFDPVHYGHLLLGEFAKECVQLHEVWFLPAAVSPHKQDDPPTSAELRIEMLKLAIAGNSSFRIETEEIARGGVSYTVDTLQRIHNQQSEAELFFLMGDDSLASLPTWHQPAKICELATIVVVGRAGSPEPNYEVLREVCSQSQIDRIKQHYVPMSLVDYSSSEIRNRIATGKSIRYQVPRAVEMFIRQHQLYRS